MEALSENIIQNDVISRLILIAIGVVVIFLVGHFVKKMFTRNITNNSNKYRANKAVNFFGYFLILIAVLLIYEDKLGNIGMAMGMAGAGIAFALQEVIISIAGWFNIMLTGNVSVGQRVKIGELKGDIIDIGIMNTTIMEIGDWVDGDLYNGRIVTLANSFVFKENTHNYSAEYPFLWDELTVPIRTESDYRLAKQLFMNVLEEICGDYARKSTVQWKKLSNKYRVEEAQVQPMVSLTFDENWITFTLRYIVDFKKRRSTKDAIFTHLLEEIKKSDGKVMIAAGSLEITNVD